MPSAYITKTSSVSPLGLTAQQTLSSVIGNQNCLSPVPQGAFPEDFPVKFIGLLPNQSLTGFSKEDLTFQDNKKMWIENLFHDFDFDRSDIDLIIFSHNFGPSYYEYSCIKDNDIYFEPQRSLGDADFFTYFSKKSDKVRNIPSIDIHNTCASSLAAIALAKNYIQAGLAKSCLVVAYELSNHVRPVFISLNTLGALSTQAQSKNRASVPFSDDRAGFVKADALGYALIQTDELAKQSGLEPISRIRGCAITSDCNSLTDGIEDGSLVERTISQCLTDANTTPNDIDYINAHGSGTYLNDQIELTGVSKVFDGLSKNIYLSSNKSQFGHALCATGLVEVDILTKMFQHNFIAPNLNYHSEKNNKNIIIPKDSILNQKIKLALKNSFGFGGYNACVIFENLL